MSHRAQLLLAFGLGSLTWPLWLAVGEEFGRWNNHRNNYAFGAK